MKNVDKKIAEKLKELEELKKIKSEQDKYHIKTLESFTVEEKIRVFESVYNFAINIYKDMVSGDWHPDNYDNSYAYEEIMSVLSSTENSEELWEHFDSLY